VPPSRDELSRLAETLNEMLARLESAIEHERRFVDDASHELRTPLALLRTEIELALRRPRSKHELEQALRSAA
jgi:two-component system OmpR family sensor kinase